MDILLTGSSGFIGTHLVQALRTDGHRVIGVDRDEPSWCEPGEFVRGDLLADGTLESAFDGIDCVFHLAAAKDDWGISRSEYFRDNVRTTEKLLEVGGERDVSRWFHYSTVGVLRRSGDPLDENARLDPETEYGASKAEAERMFREYSRSHPGASVTVLRPSAVFGPRHPANTNVHRLIEAIRANRFVMVGDGETPKTTSYIENLLAATRFLLGEMRPGYDVYHYVDQPVMTTRYLVEAIYRELSREWSGRHIPLTIARSVAYVSDIAASLLRVDFPITAARIEKFCTPTNYAASAIRDLGFEQPVGNALAVERTVRWHLREFGS